MSVYLAFFVYICYATIYLALLYTEREGRLVFFWKVKAKIEQVHQAWMKAGHKAPPANAGEEKEYKALMAQIVGHPDVSFQYSN